MEREDFVALLRKRIRYRRETSMENLARGLENNTYHKTVGRIAELDDLNSAITEILATTGEQNG